MQDHLDKEIRKKVLAKIAKTAELAAEARSQPEFVEKVGVHAKTAFALQEVASCGKQCMY
jgi:hypothetical protein